MSTPTPSRATVLLVCCALLSACGDRPPPSAPAVAAPQATAALGTPPLSVPTDAARHIAAANAAFAAGRFVSPSDDNALAWLAAAREADPDHPGAVEALVDLYPIALAAAERAIDAGDPADARRILDLLDRVQPDSLGTRGLRERLPSAPAAATESATTTATERAEAAAVAPAPPDVPAAIPAAPGATDARPATTSPRAIDDPVDGTARNSADSTPAATAASPSPADANAAMPVIPAVAAVEPPRLRSRVEPAYPQLARQRRIEGWVELEFMVGVDGTPTDIRVVESSPNAIFDSAATRALQRWRFDPARRGATPEPARTRTRITFRLG